MKKKYIALFLALLFAFSMLTVSIFATDEWDVSANGDNSVKAEWNSDTKTLTIKGNGAMKDFTMYGDAPYIAVIPQAEKVVISDGVTKIGDYAFAYMARSWYSLSNLTTSIEIPATVQSIGEYAFYSANAKSVTFAAGSQLTDIKTCAFSDSKIESINFPSNLKTIGASAFSSCNALKEAELPEGLQTIGQQAFYECGNLSYVYIPASVTSVGASAFYFRNSVNTHRVIENKGGANQDVGYDAFYFGNSNYIFVMFLNKANVNAVQSIKNNTNTDIRYYDDGESYSDDFEFAVRWDVSANGDGSVKATWNPETKVLRIEGQGAMMDMNGGTYYNESGYKSNPYAEILGDVKELYISEGITRIGANAFHFENAYSPASIYMLRSLTSPIVIPSTVQSIGDHAFKWNSSVDYIAPSALTDLTFAKDSQLKEIGREAFYETNIQSISLPNGLKTIGNLAFYQCRNLSTVSIPSSTTSIGEAAFRGCISLSQIVLPNGLETIQKNTFEGCTSLSNLVLPENIKTIGSGAFGSCTSLTEVFYPNGLQTIDEYAFQNCNNLGYVYIPESVSTIGYHAFYNTRPTTYRVIVDMSQGSQTLQGDSFYFADDYTDNALSLYTFSGNYSNVVGEIGTSENNKIYLLDTGDFPLTGTLDNGIVWTYHPDTHSLTFEGEGSIPSYGVGQQPWFGAGLRYGGIGSYGFGGGISGIGSGVFGYYGGSSSWGGSGSGGGGNYSGVSAEGTAGLRDTIENLAPGVTFTELVPKEEPKQEGIHVFVDNVEVNFPDVQPRMQGSEIYAPLRFINNDLGATVEWIGEEQKVLIKRVDNGHYVEIALKEGSSKMTVNGKQYDIGATVIIDNDRCLLPGRSIVKFWETVRFKADYAAPSFNDYYYRQSTPVDGEDEKILDYPEIDEWLENGETLTPENEEEVLGARRDPDPETPDPDEPDPDDEDDDADNIIKKPGGSGKTIIILDAEPTEFKVAVPIMIDISMDANGTVSIPNSYVVSNESAWGPVVIKNISVVKAAGWSIADYSSDFANMKVDSKTIGLRINGVTVSESGSVAMSESLSSPIRYQDSKALTFEAKLPAQKSAFKENALAVVFTVDFDKVQG